MNPAPRGTKGRHLLKGTLTDSVAQPRISGKPSFAAQHQLRLVNVGDSPPVDERAGDQRLGRLWAKFLTHEAPENESKRPAGCSARTS